MRITPIWSLLGLVALGTSGMLAGCGDDAPPKSGLGESCDKTSDCSDGLKCLEGACYKSSADANEGGDNGNVGPTPPVLSGLGETCARRADCEDGLGCFNARCVDPADGAGGGPATAALGGIGETCALTSDCENGLTCRPQVSGLGAQSVCTAVETELMATGKDCHAECVAASDCCELPIAYHSFYDGVFNLYGTGANSCADLTSLLSGVDCATTVVGAELARCFANEAFCGCAADTWSCSEMGACVYDTECTANGSVPGGCPTFSRSGRPLSTVCSADGVCGAAGATACTTDESCVNKPVVDAGDTCVADECTCYQGACYRQCNADLDCAKGRLCSEDKVCVVAPQCTSDTQCAALTLDYRFICNLDTNTCVKPCDNDLDCNPAGLTGGLQMLCNADKVCEPVGCSENDDCQAAAGGVKMFCSEKLAATPGTNVASAITD